MCQVKSVSATAPTRHAVYVAILALVAGLTAPPTAVGGIEYTVTTLSLPPGASSVVPWGLNNAGDVVGWVVTSGQPIQAFLWTDAGGMTVLPTPPGETSYVAREISDTGIIAGGHDFGRAWIYQNGQYTMLGTLPGATGGEAWGVNDVGDTGGTADPASFLGIKAFHADASTGQVTELAGWPSRAYDINNAGQVAGHSGTIAFRWTAAGGMQSLGPLSPTYSVTNAFAINNAGAIVGRGKEPTSNNNSRAFIFTDAGGMQIIPPVGLVNEAWGINDAGDVVGNSTMTGFGDKAWIWSAATGTRQLDALIDPALNMTIIEARDINNAGQIAGLAFDNNIPGFVAVRLSPVPGAPGDINGDGVVDMGDVPLFAGVLIGIDTDPNHMAAADMNGDGGADGLDIEAFVQAIIP